MDWEQHNNWLLLFLLIIISIVRLRFSFIIHTFCLLFFFDTLTDDFLFPGAFIDLFVYYLFIYLFMHSFFYLQSFCLMFEKKRR